MPAEPVDKFGAQTESIAIPASTGAVEPVDAAHVGDAVAASQSLGDSAAATGGSIVSDLGAATAQTRSMLAEYELGQTWFAGSGQKILEWVHITTGLPWWGTIVVTVLAIRIVTFPIIRTALVNGAKLAIVGPEMKQYTDRMSAVKATGDYEEMQRATMEMRGFLQKHDLKPFRAMIMPLVQMPVFIGLFFALRGFAEVKFPGFASGGLSWFTDLTVSDPLYVLPVLSSALTIAVIQSGAESATPNETSVKVKRFLTAALVISTPFIAYFPSVRRDVPVIALIVQAVFVYWVTNNTISLTQTVALRFDGVRSALGIPLVPKTAPISPTAEGLQALPSSSFMDGFRAGQALAAADVVPAAMTEAPPTPVKSGVYVPSSRNEAKKVDQARLEAAYHRDFILKQSAEAERKQAEATARAFARANAKSKTAQRDEKQRRADAVLNGAAGRRSFSSSARSAASEASRAVTSLEPPVVPLEVFGGARDAERRRAAWQAKLTADYLLSVGVAAADQVEPADRERAAREAVLQAPGGSEEAAAAIAGRIRKAYFDEIAFAHATTSLSESSAQAAASAVQRAGGLPGEVQRVLLVHAHRAAAQKAHSVAREVDEARRIKSWRVARGSGRPIVHDPRPNRRERRLVTKAYHRRVRHEATGTWKRIVGWRVGDWDRTEANALSKARRFARGTLEQATARREAGLSDRASQAAVRQDQKERRIVRSVSRKSSSKLPRIVGSSS